MSAVNASGSDDEHSGRVIYFQLTFENSFTLDAFSNSYLSIYMPVFLQRSRELKTSRRTTIKKVFEWK